MNVGDRPLTEREAIRLHREAWVRAGCSAPMCDQLELVANEYAGATGIAMQDALIHVTEVLERQIRFEVDVKVASVLEGRK